MSAPTVTDTAAGPVLDTRPPSPAKAMLDAFLDEHRHHTVLAASDTFDFLLDLRAEL